MRLYQYTLRGCTGKGRKMTDVQPGQVWEDKDKRMAGRRVTVEAVVGAYAYCADVVGKRVRLLTRRMGPGSGTHGWRLADDGMVGEE